MKPPDVDLDDLKEAAGVTQKKVADVARAGRRELGEAAGATKAKAGGLTADAKKRLDPRRLYKRGMRVDLSKLPAEAKLLYCRVLVKQARGDRVLDPREISNIYLFASTIGLDAESRVVLRHEMAASGAEADDEDDGVDGSDALILAQQLADLLDDPRREAVLTLLVKDLLIISRADARVAAEERSRITAIAALAFPDEAEKMVGETERLVEAEAAFATGKIDAGQLELRTKDIIAKAAGLGAPLAAVSLAGTGSGAVALSTGLATLGFGGILGFSAMTTGIGTAVVLGVVVYQGTRFVLGINERERKERHEFVVQESIKNNQRAIAELADDIAGFARGMEEYLPQTARNEEQSAMLKTELASLRLVLADLQMREELARTPGAVRG